MATTVRLVREGVGIELRRGTFAVEIDGDRVGAIDRHGATEFTVTPGHQTLMLRAGRYTSRPVVLDSREGEVVSLRCHGTMAWPRWLASAFRPDLAIAVVRE